jgi:hypothetical protein
MEFWEDGEELNGLKIKRMTVLFCKKSRHFSNRATKRNGKLAYKGKYRELTTILAVLSLNWWRKIL